MPAIRAANSAARSPANTRCACESTNPGSTQPPPAEIIASAAGASAAGPTQVILPRSITTAASATSPSGPSPRAGSIVASSPMSVITNAVMARSVSGPESSDRALQQRADVPEPVRAAA